MDKIKELELKLEIAKLELEIEKLKLQNKQYVPTYPIYPTYPIITWTVGTGSGVIQTDLITYTAQ